MSRSYKKNPFYKDKSRGMKTVANRKIRRQRNNIPNGKAYQKFFCSYDISDFCFRKTFAEYCANKIAWGQSDSIDYRRWYKLYKRK